MIPLYKLEKLPRTQKLRKIAKYFTFAENRLCVNGSAGVNGGTSVVSEKGPQVFTSPELIFFNDAAILLAKDTLFPHEARKVFLEAADIFNSFISPNNVIISVESENANRAALLRRALNTVKHILLSETGKEPADWDFTGADGLLDREKRKIFEGMFVYLEDIRSPFNVGAIFRAAESFGVEKIILSPFCADPRHRRAERTAMGCIDIVPWERRWLFAAECVEAPGKGTDIAPNVSFSSQAAEPQSAAGQEPSPLFGSAAGSLPVFALETGGTPLDEFKFPMRGLLIAGSEELGVSPRALAAADASLGRVSIPCYGTKASLNVSVAFGIALQKWATRLA